MEPLYPQNILERTFPIYRELREKAEKEALQNPPSGGVILLPESELEEAELYLNIPYEEGQVGRNLNTLA